MFQIELIMLMKLIKMTLNLKKIVEDEKRRINKKLKTMNARLKKTPKNNFSQTFKLDRLNRFIKDMRNTLNKL